MNRFKAGDIIDIIVVSVYPRLYNPLATMKKRIGKTHSSKKTSSELDASVVFRERKLKDIIPHSGLQHPKPIPGYKATLRGAPGWWAKESPGA